MTLSFLLIALVFLLIYLFYWRFRESTKDSYVNGNMVVVTSQIPGYVHTVTVDDTNFVHTNRVLVTLDPIDRSVALEKSKANLAETVRNVVDKVLSEQ
jgi:membrane fusion protein (multidrug efflux system)